MCRFVVAFIWLFINLRGDIVDVLVDLRLQLVAQLYKAFVVETTFRKEASSLVFWKPQVDAWNGAHSICVHVISVAEVCSEISWGLWVVVAFI